MTIGQSQGGGAAIATARHATRFGGRSLMGMPEDGFDRPFFMGHGLSDSDVPYATTVAYAAVLKSNDEPVTFRIYPTDHSGTMAASLRDTVPFVRGLFVK